MPARRHSVSVSGVQIECVRGDIAQQPGFDAVVNAANAELRIGGGVAGALHSAAGPELEEETRLLAPIRPGQAVITSAHRLPNRFVIHCLGPVFGSDEPANELLESCYRRALRLAEDHGIASIAFPAISTGAFGFPMHPAARIAMRTIVGIAPSLRSVRTVRFVLFTDEVLEVHSMALAEVLEGQSIAEP